MIITGDASTVATCALEVGEGTGELFTQNKLTQEEKELASGQRELLTFLRALQQETEYFRALAGRTIIWITDSTNLVAFLTKGTMKMAIQTQVLEVFKLLASFKIRLLPVHLKRTDFRVQWANEGSRFFDPDDWGINKHTYKHIKRHWKPTIDLLHTAQIPNADGSTHMGMPHTHRGRRFLTGLL